MTLITPLVEGSSLSTKTFVIGDAQPVSGSIGLSTTVALNPKQKIIKGSSVSSFIQELKASVPGLDEKLATSRKRLADQLTTKTTLRRLRLAKGLSQAELAKAIGTSQPHMSRIESEPEAIMFITAIKLAKALAVDVDQLAALVNEAMQENS